MKRRQNDGRYPDEYAGYSDQGYDESYDDGSGFQDDPFSETSAAANHRVKAQQAQDKRRKKKRVRIAVIVVVVLALLVGEFVVLMNNRVSPPSLSGGLSDGNPDDGITTNTEGRKKGCYTFLIAGKDRAAGLTDTVLVGMLDTENKSLKFVSIPRDTAVNVAYRPKKMNQYYAAAENNGRDGVEAMLAGVEKLLGYRVDSYAIFDVEVFVELIDAMGGTIAVESHLGQGATFTADLTVPLAEPVTAADPQQRPAGERPWGQAHPPGGGQRDQHLCGQAHPGRGGLCGHHGGKRAGCPGAV